MNLFSQNDSRVTPTRTDTSITLELECNDCFKKKVSCIIFMHSDKIHIAKYQATEGH